MEDSWPNDAEIAAFVEEKTNINAQKWAQNHITGVQEVANEYLDEKAMEALNDPVIGQHPSVNFMGLKCIQLETQEVIDAAPEYPTNRKSMFRSDLGQLPPGKVPNHDNSVSGVSSLFVDKRKAYETVKLEVNSCPPLRRRTFLKLDADDIGLPVGAIEPLCCQAFLLDPAKGVLSERWNFIPAAVRTYFENDLDSQKAAFDITDMPPNAHLVLVYYRVFQVDQGAVCDDYYRKLNPGTLQKAKASVQLCWPKLRDVWTAFAYSFVPIAETKGKFDFPQAISTDKAITGEAIAAQIEKTKGKPDTLPIIFTMVGDFVNIETTKELEPERLVIRATGPYPARLLTDFRHQLLFTLVSAKMDAPGKINVRNIVPEVLFVNGNGEPMKCIQGRWNNCGSVASAFGRSLYHEKAPAFDDEFVIDLPYNLSSDAYIIVRYHHAATQEKEPPLRAVGISIIKIFAEPGLVVEDGQRQTGIHFNLQMMEPSAPSSSNVLVYKTELKSVLVTNQPVAVDTFTPKLMCPDVQQWSDELVVNWLYILLDKYMLMMTEAPDQCVAEIVKIGRLFGSLGVDYTNNLLDAYSTKYALRQQAVQVKEFHAALLSGIGAACSQISNEFICVLRFLFNIVVKSLVITKDRTFGSTFEQFVTQLCMAVCQIEEMDKIEQINYSVGQFVMGLSDIGLYDAAEKLISCYSACFADTPNGQESAVEFLDCSVNGKLFTVLSLTQNGFCNLFIHFITTAIQQPQSAPLQGIFTVFAKLLSYVPKEHLADVAAVYVDLLDIYHDKMKTDRGQLRTSLAVLAFVMRHVPEATFAEWFNTHDHEKFFALVHFVLIHTKFISDDEPVAAVAPPPSLTQSMPGVRATVDIPIEVSKTLTARARKEARKSMGVKGLSEKDLLSVKKEIPLSLKGRTKSMRLAIAPVSGFSIWREVALEVQFAVIHVMTHVLNVTEEFGRDVHEVIYHILSMNVCIDIANALRDLIYLITEKHPKIVIENTEPPFTIFVKKLLSLAAAGNDYVADSILAVFPRIFSAEKRLYPTNNRTLVCCIRAISILSDHDLESPSLLTALKNRSDDGGNMDKITACIERLVYLNKEMKKLDPVHFAKLRETNECDKASESACIERYADDIYEKAKTLRASPDAALEQIHILATYQQKNGYLSEALVCRIFAAAMVVEYLALIGRIDNVVKLDHPGMCFAELCPSIADALCPEEILADLPVVSTYCDSKDFCEAGVYLDIKDSFVLASESNLLEYACNSAKIMSLFFENNHCYAHLADMYRSQTSFYQNIKMKPNNDSRLLGRYYRVTLLGSLFGEDDGKTFIYRELKLMHLFGFTDQLKKVYSNLYGADNIEILQNSGIVDRRLLRSDRGYIQITFVEPHFDKSEILDRQTVFECNHNISMFKFESPFVKGEKKLQGSTGSQWLRRTILKTEIKMPTITKRQIVPASGWSVIEYEPIRVACRQMKQRVASYESAIETKNMQALQPLLSGSLATQVNEGPTEIARTFLSTGPRTKYTEKLRNLFKSFIEVNKAGIELMREYVKVAPVYTDFLATIEEGMVKLENDLNPLLVAKADQ